jgi:hypothetical protein
MAPIPSEPTFFRNVTLRDQVQGLGISLAPGTEALPRERFGPARQNHQTVVAILTPACLC